ncbi:hypothetical protein GCM10018793_42020 [Streptomyces sulfonofaciens]|uniref:Amylo-alpha-1,6-glucosidase n=1 Tax=Streptomyces sulfonofaciens TaxID=68272 RepID=A0A919L3B0_9ACTN|nr:glycogen debranching N-terminal domain-containing protein [Streptomyces sulfonofaciens]GHH82362.1 hypothetical protein GCM10018793_42020 [Streptomyces sulfonofaciens]
MSHYRQPPLHELVTVLRAPSVCLSAADGQIRGEGLDGFYDSDRRAVSHLEAEVDGATLVPVGRRMDGAAEAVFSAQVRPGTAEGAPVLLHRRRTVDADGLAERFELVSAGGEPVTVRLLVRCATDLAPVHEVRGGRPPAPVAPEPLPNGVRWTGRGQEVTLTADRRPDSVRAADGTAELAFALTLAPGQPLSVHLRARPRATPAGAPGRGSSGGTGQGAPTAGDTRPAGDTPAPGESFLPLAADAPPVLPALPHGIEPPRDPLRRRLLEVSLRDLEAMLLADPRDPADTFVAAGSPWYFTLFGRDSLWSASLLLPLGTRVAAGTLRALARRQGTRSDPSADEQPGKILHEVRRETLRLRDMVIPPRYYGTIDATMLWVRLLHDGWRAGLDPARVEPLLPHLRAALEWVTEHGDADGDGLVEYRPSGHGGLANQGWKDSADAVRWADGRHAQAPLALCEVQAYAYAAAVQGADLLEAFGRPGADRWRDWAARLRERFREAFWVHDASGTYPAIALDAHKRPVDGAASNMGHLLGTGLLTGEEAALVAARLAQPDLDCGYGLRTLSAASKAFDPLSYHCGSVWPHDTAIAVLGLAAEGHHTVARSLAEGLLAAAEPFGFRLPELYGGTSARDGEPVLAYPTACRPQAWAAAGAVAVLGYLEGWPAGRGSAPARDPGPGTGSLHGAG